MVKKATVYRYNFFSKLSISDVCETSNVHFADGTSWNFTDTVVPLIIPPATQLRTFLRQWRGYWSQVAVRSAVVVGFTAIPGCVSHLRHASSATA